MEDTLEIPQVQDGEQQLPTQEDPPKKKLYDGLVKEKLYTKSFDEFQKQFSTPEAIDKLHKGLQEESLYTKTNKDFQDQYFPDVKKKDSTGLPSADGTLPSQDIPIVSLDDNSKPNAIDLANNYTSLKNAVKEVPVPSSGKGGELLTTVPDEGTVINPKERDETKIQRVGGTQEARDIKDYLSNTHGIDVEDLANETKGLTATDYGKQGMSKDELLADRSENNEVYQRKLGRLKWQGKLDNILADNLVNNKISKDDYDAIQHSIQSSLDNSSVGNYKDQRTNIQSVANAIKTFGGADKDELLKNYAVEVSKVYGNSYKNDFDKVSADTPESKYLSPEGQLGYQYLQDVNPEAAKQYDRLFIDPKTIKDDPDAKKGYDHLMQTVEETGINLQQNAVSEDLNNLKRIADKNNGLTPEQVDEATKLQAKQDELTQKSNELDKKYPERMENKVDDAMQEILGQKLGWGNYAGGKAGVAIKNTIQGTWEALSSPFMSDASNNLRELGIMGETLDENQIYHKTDANKNLLNDTLVIKPELQKQIDEIKNDKSLTREQKEMKLYPLLKDNPDKFGRVPIQNGKFNISPSSILYGVTDIGTTLLPFIGLEALTGGGATASGAQKFLSTFTAAAATSFHDEYANALLDGKPQSEAYKYAMGVTAINSLAMAGAQTPEAIKNLASKSNNSASKIIADMSEEDIQKVLDKGTPKGLKAVGQVIKDRAKATPKMIGEGLKTGAQFEAAMAGANELKHQIYNTPIDREQNFKQSVLNIANFGIMGAGLGHIGYESPTELQKSGLVKMGEKPDEFIATLDQMKKDGQVTPAEYDHRLGLIEKAKEATKSLPIANDKGKPLTEIQKGEYLYNTVIKNEGNKASATLPPKQAEKAEHTAAVADHTLDLILDPKTDKQLEDRKGILERKLEPKKDAEGKAIELPEKEVKDYKAELEAINNQIEFNTRHNKINEKENDTQSIPVGQVENNSTSPGANPISEEVKNDKAINNEEAQAPEVFNPETPNSTSDQSVNSPVGETKEEKVTGVKRSITDAVRGERNLPKVEFPKMTKDVDALNEAKERIDSGKVNPTEMVNRILTDKSGYKNEGEVMDMHYYAHQLEKHNDNLSRNLAEAKTPEEHANVLSQKQQLSDEIDAQTEAAQIAGNQWGKIGNRMQPVINDAGKIFRDDKSIIKDTYGKDIPKEVQARIDNLTKERDAAINDKAKIEQQLRDKMAEKGFEEIKKSARRNKNIEDKEALKKEEQDLLKELKKSIKKDLGNLNAGIPIPKETLETLGKLAVNYFKQGVNGVEALIDKLYDNLKDTDISRAQIKEAIANYEPLTIEREIERLNKKADLLMDKVTPPSVKTKGNKFTPSEPTDFTKPSREQLVFRKNTEWVRANQRVANAEHRMKQEKRRAFESKKNFYQKALMWAGRLTRLSVLSGTKVLAKLASALVVGGGIKRIPEQAIGAVYSKIFSGIAKKAPIEGQNNWLNAKAEAAFYKDFFSPEKFVKNSWDILKTGSTALSRRLGGAEYEHVPVLYLPTDLHQIIKDPLKRAAFQASFKNGLIWSEKNGLDINDNLVINSIENAAYKRAQYEIFQEQNWLSKKFTSYKSSLEKQGNTGATAKMLVDFMIPVSTVPLNIVRRVTTTSPLGLIRGGKEVIQAYRKGIESLSNEQADHVMQQLKQGTLGSALWLVGWFGVSSFGGLYSKFNPNSKRKEGEKMSDEMDINGVMMPKPVQHALPFEIIQMAATARRIYDHYKQDKNANDIEALTAAGLGSIGALTEQIPIVETPMHAVLATQDPLEAAKLKEDMKRRIEPQIAREFGAFDNDFKKSKEGKFLDDKGLKIVDINKEGLHPVDESGNRIKIDDEKVNALKQRREEKLQAEISIAMKNGFKITEGDGENEQVKEVIPADQISHSQLQKWLMSKSKKATAEATDEIFGQQPKKQPSEKVETNE